MNLLSSYIVIMIFYRCLTNACRCKTVNLQCTYMCCCIQCENTKDNDEDSDVSSGDECDSSSEMDNYNDEYE